MPVIRPDGTIVRWDGTALVSGWDTVSTDGDGNFTYPYQLNGIKGTYTALAYLAPWSGDPADTPVATVTFTDGSIDFRQCLNDSNNDEVADDCDWSPGAADPDHAVWAEGDAVPQRVFHQIDSAGTYTMRFEYDFSHLSKYGIDFLTNVDQTQPASLLNACGNLANFVKDVFDDVPGGAFTDAVAPTCAGFYSGATSASIPSDPFDGVASRETPASRNFKVSCEPACSGSVTVSFPSLDGIDDAGEAHDPDSDPDCFQNCGNSSVHIDMTFTTAADDTLVGVFFAGHLAQSLDPPGSPVGWGSGYGAASIGGSPIHMAYEDLFDSASESVPGVGSRDNPVNTGVINGPDIECASGTVTINKTLSPSALPEDVTFTFDVTGPNSFGTTVSLTIPAGSPDAGSDPDKDVTVTGGPGTYSVVETGNDHPGFGFGAAPSGSTNIAAPACAGSVDLTNTFAPGELGIHKTHQFSGGSVIDPSTGQWVFRLTNDGGTSIPCSDPGSPANPSDTTACTTSFDTNGADLLWQNLPADTYILCEDSFSSWITEFSNLPDGAVVGSPSARCVTFTMGAGDDLTGLDAIGVNNRCQQTASQFAKSQKKKRRR